VAFNDVDFCLRIRKKGYRNIWTPHAELYHFESASRGKDETPEKAERFRKETQYMLDTWGEELRYDPYYNINFSIDMSRLFKLAYPPRREKPW
jgi:GT2 family glycosyltransferase